MKDYFGNAEGRLVVNGLDERMRLVTRYALQAVGACPPGGRIFRHDEDGHTEATNEVYGAAKAEAEALGFPLRGAMGPLAEERFVVRTVSRYDIARTLSDSLVDEWQHIPPLTPDDPRLTGDVCRLYAKLYDEALGTHGEGEYFDAVSHAIRQCYGLMGFEPDPTYGQED